MKKINFVDLGRCGEQLDNEMREAMGKVIDSHQFIMGPEKQRFEEKFANYCGVKHCIGVDSGMSALELSLRAMNVGPGDEVITVPNTYYSTARAISKVGAKPVFVDINPDTLNIDVKKIQPAITDFTKAILPVHLYGQPVDMVEINALAARNYLRTLEDACQAHGAELYTGSKYVKTGNLGNMAAFSFYPGKNLGGFGDGGAITTNDDELADRVRLFHDHGQKVKYQHLVQGDNHRLDSIQAAVLNVKLPHLDEWTGERQEAAKIYNQQLLKVPGIKIPICKHGRKHVYHLYVIHTQDRDGLKQHLGNNGITVGLHYPTPIHLQPAFKYLGYKQGDFPNAERSADSLMSLPMFPGIKRDEIDYVCDKISEYKSSEVSQSK